MDKAPIEKDPDIFLMSNRVRFERMWVAFLYVLIEAWESSHMKRVREYIASKVSIDELTSLIQKGRKDGSVDKMREVRHYMAHRDKRKYWDTGRFSVLGQLAFHRKLHQSFFQILLVAMHEINQETGSVPEKS